MNEQTRTHYRTCNLCEAMCGIVITLDGERITSIKGDKADPFSQGHICPKATALQDIYEDPNRLKQPVKRTADGWEQIGWEEAFDLVANNIKRVQAAHGNNSVGIYLGNPNAHNLGALLFGSTLIKALRTTNRFSATSVDQLPHQFVQYQMYGHQLLFPIPDVDRTDYMLILGANPLQSNGSLMSAGGIERRLKQMQKRGGKLVVVDPRRTATAKLADEHFFIKPNHDVLLLLAMVHTLFDEGLVEMGKLADFTEGVETVRELVQGYSPERVAMAVGWKSADIRRITRELAAANSAVVYGRIGTSIQRFGTLSTWLINVLNVLTGNLDRVGGALFTTPALEIVDKRRSGKPSRWQTRVRGLPEFGGELPVAALAEEMLTEGEGQIRAMVTVAGNPVLSTPNGSQLDAGFEQLDFYAAIDIYINETTRHADVILPPTTGLEVDHFDVTFNVLAVRNVAKWSDALFEVGQDRRHEYEIGREIAKRLATDERPFNEDEPRNQMTPAQAVDLGLRFGAYELTLDELKANPHGIDLGALQEQFPARLFTPEKCINLAPEIIVQDLPYVDHLFEGTDDLALIGRRHVRDNNSWLHNSQRLVKGKSRCTVLINPDDAETRGVRDGEMVRVSSRVGTVTLPAQVSDAMMPGVVSIPHGYGHGRAGVQLDVARANAGVSVNDLTDDDLVDKVTGNAALNGVAVTVEAV